MNFITLLSPFSGFFSFWRTTASSFFWSSFSTSLYPDSTSVLSSDSSALFFAFLPPLLHFISIPTSFSFFHLLQVFPSLMNLNLPILLVLALPLSHFLSYDSSERNLSNLESSLISYHWHYWLCALVLATVLNFPHSLSFLSESIHTLDNFFSHCWLCLVHWIRNDCLEEHLTVSDHWTIILRLILIYYFIKAISEFAECGLDLVLELKESFDSFL